MVPILLIGVNAFMDNSYRLLQYNTILRERSIVERFGHVSSSGATPRGVFLPSVFCVREISKILCVSFVTTRRLSIIHGESLELVNDDAASTTDWLTSPGEREVVRRMFVACLISIQHPRATIQLGVEPHAINGNDACVLPVRRIPKAIGQRVTCILNNVRVMMSIVSLGSEEI